MVGKTLDVLDIIEPDMLATFIANQYVQWDSYRMPWLAEKQEILRYVYATDTTKTSNAKLPWSNKTTIPKLCQIRDNLLANYMASLFPKRKWHDWQGDTLEDDESDKREAIEAYTTWATDRNEWFDEMWKLCQDYIDYGNCFGTVDWVDGRIQLPDKQQVGYVGPIIRRISPLDIVINPTSPTFKESPKIVRSLISMGEFKEMLTRMTIDPQEAKDAEMLFDYMKKVRRQFMDVGQDITQRDAIYTIAGFSSYRNYFQSNFCEVLTFYGDIYDPKTEEFKRNQIIKVVDRHKIVSQTTNPSFFGTAPIYHAGWRLRADNLMAMGPLDNLVGMQYRIDHLENMKADIFDLVAYPPLKIKGYVEDFVWGPFERIYIGDDGDVELMSPDVQAMNANNEIQRLEATMEEMAGSPKEAMGFRTPGEKTKYEVQRLENASARIFQAKITQFERQMVEPLLNAMLELARRYLTPQTIRVFDSDLKINTFLQLTAEDLTGLGRIRPMAARHFAEKAQQVQDMSNFRQSASGQDPQIMQHFSTINEARLWENLLEIEPYNIVQPFVRIAEQQDAQLMQNIAKEKSAMQTQTPSGLTPDDADQPFQSAQQGQQATNSVGGGPPNPRGMLRAQNAAQSIQQQPGGPPAAQNPS